jgi:hypothetical protein
MGKETLPGEYLYQRNAMVLFRIIPNAFFDKSMPLETSDPEGRRFLREMILNRNETYRFVPKKKEPETRRLFKAIVSELRRREPGSWRLVMGYAQRLFHRLPSEYDLHIQGGDRQAEEEREFEDITRCLNEHYQGASLEDMASVFGYAPRLFQPSYHTACRHNVFPFLAGYQAGKSGNPLKDFSIRHRRHRLPGGLRKQDVFLSHFP